MFNSHLPDPFEAFIIFSIRHEIRKIDLHKRDYSLLVPGLRNTIALDFHFSQSLLYWTDVVEDKIYRGKLSDTGGKDWIFIFLNSKNTCGYRVLDLISCNWVAIHRNRIYDGVLPLKRGVTWLYFISRQKKPSVIKVSFCSMIWGEGNHKCKELVFLPSPWVQYWFISF